MTSRRLMLVHAHPDDESIGNGATMARYAAEGAEVCLVTCTLGEEGEVLVPELEYLSADRDDLLGEHRLGELKSAMAELGVTDFVRLGGDGRFRDSGMAWDERGFAVPRDLLRTGIFWTTDLLEAAGELVPLIRDRRPQVLVTYNTMGGYGHPDHIQAHRVATYARQLAAIPSFRPDLGPAWAVDRLLWTVMSRGQFTTAVQRLREAGDTETFKDWGGDEGGMADMLAPDDAIAVDIDGAPWVAAKIAAMKAHATQITEDGPFFTGLKVLGIQMWAHEFYLLAAGRPFPDADAWADDLFAGLDAQ